MDTSQSRRSSSTMPRPSMRSVLRRSIGNRCKAVSKVAASQTSVLHFSSACAVEECMPYGPKPSLPIISPRRSSRGTTSRPLPLTCVIFTRPLVNKNISSAGSPEQKSTSPVLKSLGRALDWISVEIDSGRSAINSDTFAIGFLSLFTSEGWGIIKAEALKLQ